MIFIQDISCCYINRFQKQLYTQGVLWYTCDNKLIGVINVSYMKVEFPGGLRVDAKIGDHLIKTDQSVVEGGEGSAPSPFELFLSSIATCVGIYTLSFCKNKEISTEGMSISMDLDRDKSTGLVGKIDLNLQLPEGFPRKYEKAIIKSMELCTVKKHLQTPPEFKINILKED